MSEQLNLFNLSAYDSISLANQIKQEEIDRESDAYNESLYQKSSYRSQNAVENNSEIVLNSNEKTSIKCLTLKQPWAWAIFNLGKNIENRGWKIDYRGLLYIHSGLNYDSAGEAWIKERFDVDFPGGFDFGAILGSVNLTEISSFHGSWAMPNQWHWKIENPMVLQNPFKVRGHQGIWNFETPSSSLLSVKAENILEKKIVSPTSPRKFKLGNEQPPIDSLKGVSIVADIDELKPPQNYSPKPMRGRPPGGSNKKRSGSFYKRGVNKKGVEQWSFHYHYYDDDGKARKTSISVPFQKLREAKNIAHLKGLEAVIKFLKRR